jgi:gliding motility-associated lipoprotein GldD
MKNLRKILTAPFTGLALVPFSLFLVSCSFLLASCNSSYQPESKKKGYYKIEFPEKEYQSFDQPGYPYTFEYPKYAEVIKDTTFFDDKAGDWWINIDIPRFAGRIHVSYKAINAANRFDSLVKDGFKMAYKQHVDVSTGIDEKRIQTPNGVTGMYFDLGGNTATANQFFLTDTTKNFLRGALYFDAAPNSDSLSIVNDFLRKDLEHLINTLRWK